MIGGLGHRTGEGRVAPFRKPTQMKMTLRKTPLDRRRQCQKARRFKGAGISGAAVGLLLFQEPVAVEQVIVGIARFAVILPAAVEETTSAWRRL